MRASYPLWVITYGSLPTLRPGRKAHDDNVDKEEEEEDDDDDESDDGGGVMLGSPSVAQSLFVMEPQSHS